MRMDKTKEVENWWDTNPFTYNGDKGVGKIAEVDAMDTAFFDTAERKYRKNTDGVTQDSGKPVFSKFVPFESLHGKRVLDIAVGTGFSAVTFAQAGAEVTGIDLTEFAVQATKKNFEVRGLKGTVLQMDAQHLDFPDNYFDYVCAHGCLMHMPDTNKAIGEMYRVLKPGGEVYAWMYHKGWHYWFGIIFLRGILAGGFFKYGFTSLALTSRYSDGAHQGGNPHTKFFSRRGFRSIFENQKFTDVRVFANHSPAEWTNWPARSFPLGFLVPSSIQRFLSEKAGFAFSCSITAKKK